MEWTMADKFTPYRTELENRYGQINENHGSTHGLWVQNFRKQLDIVARQLFEFYSGLKEGEGVFINPRPQGDYAFTVTPQKIYQDPEAFVEALWRLGIQLTTGKYLPEKDKSKALIAELGGRVGLFSEIPAPQDVTKEDSEKVIKAPAYLKVSYETGTPGPKGTSRYTGTIFLKQDKAQFPYFLLRKPTDDQEDYMNSVSLSDIRGPFAEVMKELYEVEEKPTGTAQSA